MRGDKQITKKTSDRSFEKATSRYESGRDDRGNQSERQRMKNEIRGYKTGRQKERRGRESSTSLLRVTVHETFFLLLVIFISDLEAFFSFIFTVEMDRSSGVGFCSGTTRRTSTRSGDRFTRFSSIFGSLSRERNVSATEEIRIAACERTYEFLRLGGSCLLL